MNQKRFKEILDDYFAYLYPNIVIDEEVEFDDQSYSILLEDGSMNVKGDIHDTKGYNIYMDQEFLPTDAKLVSNFLSEINTIDSSINLHKEYIDTLIRSALSKAISQTLSQTSSDIIEKSINILSRFSQRTYEGNEIVYGIIVNDKILSENRVNNIYLEDFIDQEFSIVLSNGIETFVEVDQDGYLVKYLELHGDKASMGLSPYDYSGILEYCGENTTGIVLTARGEILIFHQNELKYTKRGGQWNPYSHKEIIKLIYDKSLNDNLLFSKSIYLTALDVSFSYKGGIICFLNENEIEQALKHINIKDIVNEKYFEIKKLQMKDNFDPEYERIKDKTFTEFLRDEDNTKSCVLNKLIASRKFFQLYRNFRQELVSIDGATIIDYNGDIVAVGAIIKIEAGSLGGGRLAAAKTLSKYGVSIEISSDSSITGFALDENGYTETIFTISDYS